MARVLASRPMAPSRLPIPSNWPYRVCMIFLLIARALPLVGSEMAFLSRGNTRARELFTATMLHLRVRLSPSSETRNDPSEPSPRATRSGSNFIKEDPRRLGRLVWRRKWQRYHHERWTTRIPAVSLPIAYFTTCIKTSKGSLFDPINDYHESWGKSARKKLVLNSDVLHHKVKDS